MTDNLTARLTRLHDEIVTTAPGINSPEYKAFLFIAGNEGTSQRQVREHLDMPQATVSRLVSRLNGETYGLIRCEERGRQHVLSPSPKGRQLLARLAVLLGCFCVAPAAIAMLAQTQAPSVPCTGYEACLDASTFACDVS